MAYFEWANDMVIDQDGTIDQDRRQRVDLVRHKDGHDKEILAFVKKTSVKKS